MCSSEVDHVASLNHHCYSVVRRTITKRSYSVKLSMLNRLVKQPLRRVWLSSYVRYISHKHDFDQYCFEAVKTHNYEGFLAGLLLPAQFRGAYYAIHAFNVEIATIKDQVPRNSAQAGKIRFQFWKDVFHQIYFEKKLSLSNTQPVAQALNYYIPKHDLTLRWFERALEVRFQDMMTPADFSTMDDLEDYAEYSQSSLLYLTLESMGVKDENTEFIASHLGVCKGILTLLRGHPVHQTQGLCYFPREVMKKHALSSRVALKGPTTEAEASQLKDVVNDLASQAHAHLSKARELSLKGLPPGAHYALIPSVGLSLYLDKLHQDDFALVEDSNTHFHNLKLQAKIMQFLFTKKL